MFGGDWGPFINGGIASMVAEFGTFPIDLSKTRLQVQGQVYDAHHSTVKYKGMTDVFIKMVKEEGFTSLYYGIWPAILRQATYGTIKFGLYYSMQSLIRKRYDFEGLYVNVFCASVAGAVAAAVANPTDVVKVRMQVRSGDYTKALTTCVLEIYKNEGVRGFYRGTNPTAQRAAIVASVELPIYDFCKKRFMEPLGDRITNHFVSSVIAGFTASLAACPVDVIRTRIMNQKKYKHGAAQLEQHVRLYKGMIDCAVQTVRHEGLLALYKGFTPSWLRMGPWNVLFFITYEQLKRLY